MKEYKKKEELDMAYEATNYDFDRLKFLHDWNKIATDLVDEDENWNWLNDSKEPLN